MNAQRTYAMRVYKTKEKRKREKKKKKKSKEKEKISGLAKTKQYSLLTQVTFFSINVLHISLA